MNLCMCADMYACFKNPFYPAGRRLKAYYVVLAVLLLIMTLTGAYWLKRPEDHFRQFNLPLVMDFGRGN